MIKSKYQHNYNNIKDFIKKIIEQFKKKDVLFICIYKYLFVHAVISVQRV